MCYLWTKCRKLHGFHVSQHHEPAVKRSIYRLHQQVSLLASFRVFHLKWNQTPRTNTASASKRASKRATGVGSGLFQRVQNLNTLCYSKSSRFSCVASNRILHERSVTSISKTCTVVFITSARMSVAWLTETVLLVVYRCLSTEIVPVNNSSKKGKMRGGGGRESWSHNIYGIARHAPCLCLWTPSRWKRHINYFQEELSNGRRSPLNMSHFENAHAGH